MVAKQTARPVKTGARTASRAGAAKPAGKAAAGAKSASKTGGAKSHYRKGGKSKGEDEEEISDFEEVAMSDSDVDMESSLVPRKRPTSSMDLDDLMGEANVEEEEEFIANANMVSSTLFR